MKARTDTSRYRSLSKGNDKEEAEGHDKATPQLSYMRVSVEIQSLAKVLNVDMQVIEKAVKQGGHALDRLITNQLAKKFPEAPETKSLLVVDKKKQSDLVTTAVPDLAAIGEVEETPKEKLEVVCKPPAWNTQLSPEKLS